MLPAKTDNIRKLSFEIGDMAKRRKGYIDIEWRPTKIELGAGAKANISYDIGRAVVKCLMPNALCHNIFMDLKPVIKELKEHKSPKNIAGMARFGINPKNTLGISIPFLRQLAKKIGPDHKLALQLWKTGIHEARLLAGFIDDPRQVTVGQMESWVKDFDSWDICDQVVMNLFDRTPYAWVKAKEWARNKSEFVRRAGFAMMASLAVHDKKAPDAKFLPFFRLIEQYAADERNFVKKANNWALRQIGKKRAGARKTAIALAKKLAACDSPAARWNGKDALRELSRL
jgi:3-methyladenine DNA glycosylase AlkD